VAIMAALAGAAILTGCGGVNHDSQNPQEDIQYQWVRIETPPSFQTIMFGCFGTTGMYLDQGDGNLSQIENDGMCPISRVFDPDVQKKYHFRLVTRTTHDGAGNS
jgi:hypothetical protein